MKSCSLLECPSYQIDFCDSPQTLEIGMRIEEKEFVHHKRFEMFVVHLDLLLLLVLLLHQLLLGIGL